METVQFGKIKEQSYTMKEGKWIGAKVGLMAIEPAGKTNRGWIDADWFRITK